MNSGSQTSSQIAPQVNGGNRYAADLCNLRVLLVEDDPYMLKLMQKMLRHLGITSSRVAEDGRAALMALAEPEAPINLVISDARMPNMDGLALLRQIRADKKEIPFLLVTGFADAATVQAAKLGRADAVIAKPFSPEQLAQKLLTICRRP